MLDEHVELHGIDKEIVGPDGELLEGSGHCLAAGLVDVPSVDARSIYFGIGPGECVFPYALRERERATYLLSTKVGRLLEPRQDAPRDQHGYVDTLPFVQRYDYSADGVRRSLDDSLQRLGLARVDIAYVHDIDRDTHGSAHPARLADALDGGLPALAELKAEGVIDAYGLGVNDVAICSEVLRYADLDVILLAGRYTLADQSALAQLLPECERRGVAVVIGGPYNSGILATGSSPKDGSAPYFNYAPAPPQLIARVAAIERVCAEFDVLLKAAALQFPRAHPAVATVLIGARSIAELDESLRMAATPIPSEFWQALRKRALVAGEAPLPDGAP